MFFAATNTIVFANGAIFFASGFKKFPIFRPPNRNPAGRGSSGVEQLIRNQQVVSSNLILGSFI